jgi:hypothetical protein
LIVTRRRQIPSLCKIGLPEDRQSPLGVTTLENNLAQRILATRLATAAQLRPRRRKPVAIMAS